MTVHAAQPAEVHRVEEQYHAPTSSTLVLTEHGKLLFACTFSAFCGVASYDQLISPRTRRAKIIPLHPVNPSLKKKARQERMSNFEREYPW